MSLLSRTHISTLPLTVAERLDVVCDRFEAACEGGQCPRIGDYLEGVDEPARGVLARELIVLDLHLSPLSGKKSRRSPTTTPSLRTGIRPGWPARSRP